MPGVIFIYLILETFDASDFIIIRRNIMPLGPWGNTVMLKALYTVLSYLVNK